MDYNSLMKDGVNNMAKSKETFNKREKEKKRLQQRQEKREKMQQRKAEEKKHKSLDEMIAYVDENGNLSTTPPDPKKRKVFTLDEVPAGVPVRETDEESDTLRKGMVQFFNESKGFGFIVDEQSEERIFVHISQLSEPIKERDLVHFEVEQGERGLNAVHVRKIM
jgi:cold shock CspA family protein